MSRAWIDALFLRFARIWPRQWAQQMADVSPADHANEWQLGLVGLTGAEIAEGINAARKTCTWPPTIAEFRKLATKGATAEQRAADRLMRDNEQLALPTGTWQERKAIAAAELDRILTLLKQHQDTTETDAP